MTLRLATTLCGVATSAAALLLDLGGPWQRATVAMVSAAAIVWSFLAERRTSLRLDAELARLRGDTVRTISEGLAHELNNLLTPIGGWAELIVETAEREAVRQKGRRILESATAAASITQALMAYTHQGAFHPIRADLAELLQTRVVPAVSKKAPPGVDIDTSLDPGVQIMVDPTLLESSLAALVSNAVDAMPEGGRITVELKVRRDGSSCVLAVRDTGTGIAPEHIDRVFEPFFTTKDIGKGRGLGLAAVQGVAARHGGRVWIDSRPGAGTTVSIELPTTPATAPTEAPSAPRIEPEDPLVLLLYDDQDVVDELEELLLGLRCRPHRPADAGEAQRLLRAPSPEARLVLVGEELGDPARRELILSAHAARPRIPVVLTLRLPSPSVGEPVTSDGCVRCPLDRPILSRVVSDLLRGTDSAADATANAAPAPAAAGRELSRAPRH